MYYLQIGVFPSNFVEMCAVIESPKTPVKPNPNNKQQSNQSIHQIDNQTGLQNLAKKNSLKTAAAVADKNRKNESNNGISNTVSSGKIGK